MSNRRPLRALLPRHWSSTTPRITYVVPAGGCTKRNVQPACRDDMSAVPSATQSVTPLPATVSHSCFAALHHCAM